MGKKADKAKINFRQNKAPPIRRSHTRQIMRRNGHPPHHRTVSPDDTQTDAIVGVIEFVRPDGSVNFFAELTSSADKDGKDPEPNEDE
ncbi:MAG: hypothetical protein ACOYUZ_00650 [Patescibacteria group bacterium]